MINHPTQSPILDRAGKPLDLSRPRIMGILNVTPDSFSDGGVYLSVAEAVEHARRMVAEGADIIDVGGESTRPGATTVTVEEELARVIPVIQAIAHEVRAPISIDTSKPRVMTEAVAAGAGLINDVNALRAEGALEAARDAGAAICIMHMRGEPRTMQQEPVYQDVVAEVRTFLMERMDACQRAGIPRERLIIDPGFGFGKTLEHNIQLLRGLESITSLGRPVLVGLSRKSMIGAILDTPVDRRLYGSLALAVLAVVWGASILRVHDVGPTLEALTVTQAILEGNSR